MAKINIRESLGRIDLLTDNKYDLRNTYDSSNISNDKKKKLAESISNNASAKQLYSILNESFEEPGVNVTEEISDTIRTGMLSGMVGNDIWEVFFESGPTDVLDSDLEDISDDVFDGRLSGKTSRGIGWQIRVGYNDDYYDYNCLNCPEDDYVGSRWEEYDESLNEEDNFNSDEYERKHILRLAKSVEEASKRKGMNISNLKKTAKRYIENHKDTKNKKELDELIKAYKSLDDKEECLKEDTVKQNGKWVNKGEEGTHGKFKTKKAADAKRKAMFANGYKAEALEESLEDEVVKQAKADAKQLKSNYRKQKNVAGAFNSLGYKYYAYNDVYEKNAGEYTIVFREIVPGKFEFSVFNDAERTSTPWDVVVLFKSNLKEANYGGAYDIDPEMFWTKDDLIEFSDAVCDKLSEKFGYQYDIADVGAENNNDMYITIMDTTHDIEADVSFRIKMSRIRAPRDLMKYLDTVVSEFVKKFEEEYQYYDFDESLNEDMSKPDFVVGFYAGPTDEETLEITNPKKLMDVGVSASELKKEYSNVEKLLGDYTSQTADKLKDENHQSYLKSLILSFAERKARESGKLDKAFRDEQRKFSDTDVSMDIKIEEVNYPFEDGIKKLSKQLGKMLLPKRENLTEDVYDEESDFGDGSVEEGDTFIEDGRTWSWIERIAGPIHLDFDNWAVWSARDWDYIEEKVKPLLVNKEEFNVEVLTKIYDEAEVAYFVVDEDTGFIDWGPVESQTEAQDFLNGKVEDWENDEYDESLKESKQLKESYGLELEYDDIDGDGSSYTYEVDEDKVLDYLRDRDDYPEEIGNLPDDEFQAWFKTKEYDEWLEDNLYELFEKHYDDLLDYFKEDAQTEYFDKYGDEYSQDRETGSWYRR